MDETKLALKISEFLYDYIGDSEDSVEDAYEEGWTAMYLTTGGKRFKVAVKECGEDV